MERKGRYIGVWDGACGANSSRCLKAKWLQLYFVIRFQILNLLRLLHELLVQICNFRFQNINLPCVLKNNVISQSMIYQKLLIEVSKKELCQSLTDGWICSISFRFARFHWCEMEFLGHQIFSLPIIYHLIFSLFVTKKINSLPTIS